MMASTGWPPRRPQSVLPPHLISPGHPPVYSCAFVCVRERKVRPQSGAERSRAERRHVCLILSPARARGTDTHITFQACLPVQ